MPTNTAKVLVCCSDFDCHAWTMQRQIRFFDSVNQDLLSCVFVLTSLDLLDQAKYPEEGLNSEVQFQHT